MLHPCRIPGLFITATDTAVGKTLIAAAIAAHLKSLGKKIAVCKPIATGCNPAPSPGTPGEGRGGGTSAFSVQRSALASNHDSLISDDAQFLAHHAGTNFALDIINPQRFVDPLAPAVAAGRENRTVDWAAIQHAVDQMQSASDAIIIEGVGGVMVPLTARSTVLDMIGWLGLPAVVVVRPSLGTINHTLLTLQALRSANIPIAGIIINRFPADPDLAEQTNPAAIEQFGRVKILATVPDSSTPLFPQLPREILDPIARVDWPALLSFRPSAR